MYKVARIRQLNDWFRTTFIGGQVMLTLGIRTKPEKEIAEILERVRTFNEFNKNNDVYGEHDCASFTYNGEKIVWKIDYYSPDMKYGSEDPSNPSKCARALTIMLASEW